MLEDRLSSLPTEIIQRIALETVPLSWNYAETPRGRPGPPTTLWALHLTSRRLRDCLLFAENPVFYATVFERAFDFDSVRRRYSAWSPSAETLSSTQTGFGSAMFGPAAFAWEGRKRWYVLHRVRKAAKQWEREYGRSRSVAGSTQWLNSYSADDLLSDLWTLYLMLLENDGKNAVVLMQWSHLASFLEMCCAIYFGPLVGREGWPRQNLEEVSLLVWVLSIVDPQGEDVRDTELFWATKAALRAFAFGAFKYPISPAPLSTFLPVLVASPVHVLVQEALYLPDNHHLRPIPPAPPALSSTHTMLTSISYYGRRVWFSPPSIALGAIFWYFRDVESQGIGVSTPTYQSPKSPQLASFTSKSTSDPSHLALLTPPPSTTTFLAPVHPFTPQITSGTTSLWTTAFLFPPHPLADTDIYDIEERGLSKKGASGQFDDELLCRAVGLEIAMHDRQRFKPGSLEGAWEGGFLYLDFALYASFLSGEARADREFYISEAVKLYGSNRQVWKLTEYYLVQVEDKTGRVIEGDHLTGVQPGKWLDGYIPSRNEVTWVVGEGGLHIDIEERDGGTRWKYQRSDIVAKAARNGEIVDAFPKDIIIIGEGHSAWGEATLKGRVRPYDGMVSLVKSYPNRGTWVYLGYLLDGENIVGRWRDRATSEDLHGYEGPFTMRRRRQQPGTGANVLY